MPINEANDSVSPNSAGFSAEGGRAEWLYYCKGSEVETEALALLGWVEPAGDGTLTRELPRVHPQYPWMIATTVNVRGQGIKAENEQVDEDGLPLLDDDGFPLPPLPVTAAFVDSEADPVNLPAATPAYLSYVRYDLQTTFEAVPYAVYPDSDIEMLDGTWVDDAGGAPKSFTYATEYKRYVDWPRFPATEFLQFRHGQMIFRTTGVKPNGYPFSGLSRIPLRKKLLKAMWYRVPESYVTHEDSYLDRFLWRVNQKAVTFGGEDYEPGQLLYAGYSFPKRQNQPFPDPDFPGFFTTTKVLDIELTFAVCRWFDPDAPTPANLNWIAAGHNLEMSAYTRRPHYVTTVPLKYDPADPAVPPAPPTLKEVEDTDTLKWYPKYFSCPMELLFTDPAFTQDIGVLRE